MTSEIEKNAQPKLINSEENRLEWYKNAGMLSISKPEWAGADGHPRQGKTVVLNIPAMADSEHREPALEMFQEIVDRLEQMG